MPNTSDGFSTPYVTVCKPVSVNISLPIASSILITAVRACSGVKNAFFAAAYLSIVPKKSKWSREKLVNAATSYIIPSTLRSASACADTSITTYSTPAATMSASVLCRSMGSGVVSVGSRLTPANSTAFVPISPQVRPAASIMLFMIYVVVVLPFVPVMPIGFSRFAGYP